MRSFFILTVFVMLMLQPGAISAETFNECQASCAAEMAANTANCPPFGDEARNDCMKENQAVFTVCIDSCTQAGPASDAPVDTPAEMPTDTRQDMPVDTPDDTVDDVDIPKEN